MKINVALLLLFAASAAGAQTVTVPKNIRATNTLDNLIAGLSTTRDHLYGLPLEPGGVQGDAYLDSEWKRTTLMLYDADKMIEGYLVRYGISDDHFEIKSSGGVKLLHGKKVKSFVWIDSITNAPHYFVNGRDLRDEANAPITGFFEVLTEGNLTLLSKTHVVVKDPTYNEKFDVGKRDTRILKKTGYYFADKNVVREVPASKKKLLAIFGDRATDMDSFVRTNNLSLNEPVHLRSIFEHYNSLAAVN